jgi:hypothetical protein
MAGRWLRVLVVASVGVGFVVACGGGAPHRSSPSRETGATPVSGSERGDLRSPDVDARMDPAARGVFSCPGAARVEVVFDQRGTVAVFSGGRPLIYGTVGTRAVNRACRARGRLRDVPRGDLTLRQQTTRMTCSVPRSARFEIHPITTAVGDEIGSTIAVLERNLRTIVLSAVLEPEASRIYYGRSCRIA